MHRAAHDQGFVASSPEAAYAALADLPSYPEWWPDARGDRRVVLGGRGLRIDPSSVRPGIGLVLGLCDGLDGTLEWHLQPEADGTIVNSILNIEAPGGRWRSDRLLLRCRASIRRALVGLKGRLG